MMRILIICNCELCPEAVDALGSVAAVDYRASATRDEVLGIISDFDAVMCDASVKFDHEMIARATKLRLIGTPSTGTDHLDKKCLAEHGIEQHDIAVEYELLDQFTATAEGAWLLLLAAMRQFPRQFERAKRGELAWNWNESGWVPNQLAGLTLGIAGYGRLGSMVGPYGKAFRMRVLAFDRKKLDEPGIEQVDLDTFLAESDVISIHLHLTDETHHFFDRQRIAQMKKGVVIINTARGDLIDEDALIDALESGHVAAAGVDVVHDEWDPNRGEHRLHQYARAHDNLVITPHVASACRQGCVGARVFMAQKLARRLRQISQDR